MSLRLGGSASGSPGAFSPYTSPRPQDSVSRRCLERCGLLHAPAHRLPALEATLPLAGSQTAVSVCHAADAACRDSPASCLFPCYCEPLRVSTLPGYPGIPRAWLEPWYRAERAPASTSSSDRGMTLLCLQGQLKLPALYPTAEFPYGRVECREGAHLWTHSAPTWFGV